MSAHSLSGGANSIVGVFGCPGNVITTVTPRGLHVRIAGPFPAVKPSALTY